jgi:hypothetical protein
VPNYASIGQSSTGGDDIGTRVAFKVRWDAWPPEVRSAAGWQADKTALVDVPEGAWAEAFAAELKSNLKGRALDYILLGHFNPRIAKTLSAVHTCQP